jgi:hypothetical protein
MVISLEIKLISDARERLAEEEKKRERTQVLRQTLRAQEAERKRISQELHDGVAQTLLVTATMANNLLESQIVAEDSARIDLEAIRDKSWAWSAEVRTICKDCGQHPRHPRLVWRSTGWRTMSGKRPVWRDVDLVGRARSQAEESLTVFRMSKRP